MFQKFRKIDDEISEHSVKEESNQSSAQRVGRNSVGAPKDAA